MNVLLTGGAGFIGANLAGRLLERGHHVTILDNFDLFYPRELKEKNLACLRSKYKFRLIEADIRDESAIDEEPGVYHVIVHLAGKAGVLPSLVDPRSYQSVNVLGTQNLLELARRLNIPQFVFASSSSVYGVNPRTPWSESDNVLLPISPYASTKVSGELLGHVYSRLYGIRFVALRLFTVFGPLQRPDLAIRKFATLIHEGRSIPLFGDGETSRDYTFIDDIVDGIYAAIHYSATSYEVINLGNNHPVSLLALVRNLERSLKQRASIEWKPAQSGDVPHTWADTRKAQELLNWRARTSFEEGIDRFVSWFLENSGAGRVSNSE